MLAHVKVIVNLKEQTWLEQLKVRYRQF